LNHSALSPGCPVLTLWILLCSLYSPAEEPSATGDHTSAVFLINIGDESTFTTDGTNTWQSIDLSSSTGGGNAGNLNVVEQMTLTDIQNDASKGLTFSVSPNPSAANQVGNQDAVQVLASHFSENPFTWFDPGSADQRSTHSIGHNSGEYVFTFAGFETDDVVQVEFVFGRAKPGDRAVTVTRVAAGDVANDVQVGVDGGPAYPTAHNLTGFASYTFRITSTGSTWGCLPNAMRIVVTPEQASSGGTCTITSPSQGATVYPDNLLTVSVSAAGTNTTVSQVDLFEQGVLVGTDSVPPYEFIRGYPGEGALAFRAVARFANGLSATNDVSVVVAEATGRAWTRYTLDSGLNGADGVRSGDVDGDGDEDLIVSWEEAGTVRVYENPGASRAALTNSWAFVSFSNGLANVEDAGLADLDGDGRLDIVAATEGGNRNLVVYWAPEAAEDYWDASNWTSMTLPAAAGKQWMFTRFLDVDGDGRLDIVAGSKSNGATVSWLKAPLQPRTGADWQKYKITDAGWIMSLEVEDMDGDGDPDIVISDRRAGGTAQGVRWLSHPGQGSPNLLSPWTSHTLAGAGEEVMFLDIADLDGDGLRDIVVPVLQEGLAPNDWLFLRRLDASGLNWSVSRRTFPSGTGESKALQVADVNGDTRLDLIAFFGDAVGMVTGGIWLEHDGDPVMGTWSERPLAGIPGEKFDRILPLDVDGDGDLDVIQTDEDEQNTTNGLGLVVYENPVHKDLDGDGKTDQEEFDMGTDPLDADKLLQINGIEVESDGTFTLYWTSDQTGAENPAMKLYRVMYTDDPLSGTLLWNELQRGVPPSGTGTNSLRDESSQGADQRFYRIEVEEDPLSHIQIDPFIPRQPFGLEKGLSPPIPV